MSNRLKNESSPYLRQHSKNPVDWYPWCDEAFEKAKAEDKPIFLSIGYSTCHWCHVMAHESFESQITADILNRDFIAIKVDREERPDIDSVYMSVCQAFTGSGGWPMSIFMTYDKKPFFAGTYFPVYSQSGMPGFNDLLNSILNHWKNKRSELLRSADQIINHIRSADSDRSEVSGENMSEKALRYFIKTFDSKYGGFGSAPKFPTPHNLIFLLLCAKQNNNLQAQQMAEKTLVQMRKGGIFDHIGYGFSRYSTDKYFLAPHFEKMLYDNALLIIAYSAAYSISKNDFYLDTARKTAEYVLREMISPEGAFYCAQDADSEGVEGKYYTFTPDEIFNVIGVQKGVKFSDAFDITSRGNFEGVNIPNLLKNSDPVPDFNEEKQMLYNYRKKRTKLHLDDKILVSWNSMMIAALAILYRVDKKEEYINAAKSAQKFIEENMIREEKIYTSYRDRSTSKKGFLDDYAFYTTALIELYNSTLEKSYITKAEFYCSEAVRLFYDNVNGGFNLCNESENELFTNPKETYDGAVPSGNSVMAYDLVRLYQLTDKEEFKETLKKQTEFMSAQTHDYPWGSTMFLIAELINQNPPDHILAVIKDNSDLSDIKDNIPLLANVIVTDQSGEYELINDQTTYYVCKNHTCYPPSNTMNLSD